jgi:hypothetical protein
LVGLFALGSKPTAAQLTDWLPDRWQIQRTLAARPISANANWLGLSNAKVEVAALSMLIV